MSFESNVCLGLSIGSTRPDLSYASDPQGFKMYSIRQCEVLNCKYSRLISCAHSVPKLHCATLLTFSRSGGEREDFSHSLANLFLWRVRAGFFDWTVGDR